MTNTKKYLYMLFAASFLFVGCRTLRQTKQEDLSSKQLNEQLLPLVQPQTDLTDITAKTAITIDFNYQPTTLKGRLRMRRNEIVQISVTALGVVEVALIEITPETICLIDRVNKKYAKIEFSSGLLNNIGINFATIQALFWNRIFIPGEKNAWNHLDDFKLKDEGTQICIEPKRQTMLKSSFYVDDSYKQLQQTKLMLNNYDILWRYDMFGHLGANAFPTVFDISVSTASSAASAHIALSNLSCTEKGWEAGTNLSRYTQVGMEELLSVLNLFR